MKILLSVFLLVSFTLSEKTWELSNSTDGAFTFIELDEQGGIYLINKEKHLLKLNPALDTNYVFNEKSAEVDFVAPQNALKILTFNKDLNTLQFLDKTLSQSSDEINLDNVNLSLVQCIGMSRDNNFWVFDQDEQALKKFDVKMNNLSNSGDLMNITNDSWAPTRLKEIGDKVYLNDSVKGILEFDYFGSYIQTIKVKVKGNFYLKENNLWYLRNDSLIVRDLLLHDESKYDLPQKKVVDFAYYKSQLYLLTQEKLYIYGLSK